MASEPQVLKVLVPIDFSQTSRRALAWAFDYALRAPCQLHVIHVVEDSRFDDQFRATGRSTMGVKFVSPKNGDSVAVVARSVEKDSEVEEAVEEAIAEEAGAETGAAPEELAESSEDQDSATIGSEDDTAPDGDGSDAEEPESTDEGES